MEARLLRDTAEAGSAQEAAVRVSERSQRVGAGWAGEGRAGWGE